MSNVNLFERLSISKLIQIIGEQKLDTVSSTLNLLNSTNLTVGEVYTKGFLSKFALKTLSQEFVGSRQGFETLLDTLTLEELKSLAQLQGSDLSRAECVANVKNRFNTPRSRSTFFSAIGFNLSDQNTLNNFREVAPFEYLAAHPAPYKPLKDYQFEVFFKAVEDLDIEYSRFILQMPTGSGKTRTAIEIAATFLNKFPESSVVWLAHSTELCDQACECFLEVWPHLSLKAVYFQRHYSQYRLDADSTTMIDFLCTSFQTAYSTLSKDTSYMDDRLHKKRLIIVDEAHKVIAPTYRFVTQSLQTEGTRVMGLTATPGRRYAEFNDDDENAKLADYFFEKIISFDPKNKNAIQYLRDKGVLSNASEDPLRVSSQVVLTPRELKHVEELLEIPAAVLKRIGTDNVRNAEILVKLNKLIKDGTAKSILFFATSVEHSILISSLLKFLGIRAEHIDGKTPTSTRNKLINEFKKKEIDVLCNYEVLATGFDSPKVDCVFLARPTASVVLYSQMIGRGLRGPAMGGTETCLIVNVKDNFENLPSIDRMYKVFEDYWKY